jgi:hypothetical protein
MFAIAKSGPCLRLAAAALAWWSWPLAAAAAPPPPAAPAVTAPAAAPAAEPAPAFEDRWSEDGRTYSLPALGLSIHLPAEMAGWQKSKGSPSASVLLAMVSPVGVALAVTADSLDETVSIELAAPFIEAGLRSKVPGFAKLDGRIVEMGSARAYDLSFRGTGDEGDDLEIRGVMRVLVRGPRLATVTLVGPASLWPAHETLARELFAGITTTPATPPPSPAAPAGGPPPSPSPSSPPPPGPA